MFSESKYKMKQYYIFHPHNTPEEDPKVKYHIVSNRNPELSTLCGIDTTEKLPNYSCNGDAITLDWYKQNIETTAIDGIVCKKCAKKMLKILEKRKQEYIKM